MNLPISIELRGHDLADYIEVTVGAIELFYDVGTQANAAINGSWPKDGALNQEAHHIKFYAAEDTFVRFVPLWITSRQAQPMLNPLFLPAGLPVQVLIPKTTLITFDLKAWRIYYVQSTAGGKMKIWMEG